MFIGLKGISVVGSAVGNISGPGYDSDAQAYIDAVESADGQALETDVKEAYNNFFVGLKDDGIFSDLTACCITMGARTIAGALTPLVSSMATPTNNNFVSGDYSRTQGLEGDGSTKYLDSNHLATDDATDDCHCAVYEPVLHQAGAQAGAVIGYQDVNGVYDNAFQIVYAYNSTFVIRCKDRNVSYNNRGSYVGFSGLSRSSSSGFTLRYNGTDYAKTATSSTPPPSTSLYVMAQNHYGEGLQIPSNGKIAFYSVGAALDLATLDSRVSTLFSDIGAALP